MFKKKEDIMGYSRSALWQHSIGVALCSKIIYRKIFRMHGDSAYCMGLIHDIGIVIEDQVIQKDFYKSIELMNSEKTSLIDVENKILDFSHIDIGSEIVKKCNFPQNMVAVIEHDEKISYDNSEFSQLTNTIFLTNCACRINNIGFKECYFENMEKYHECLEILKIPEDGLKIIIDEVKQQMELMRKEGVF